MDRTPFTTYSTQKTFNQDVFRRRPSQTFTWVCIIVFVYATRTWWVNFNVFNCGCSAKMLCGFDGRKQKYHCATRDSFPCLWTKYLTELRLPKPSIMCLKLFSYNSSSYTVSFFLVSWQSRFHVTHLLLVLCSHSVVCCRSNAFLPVFSLFGFTL